jgi:lysine-N-methylase
MSSIKLLPILEQWECKSCARCCRGSIIRLDDEDLRRLNEQHWEKHPDFRGVKTVIRDSWFSSSSHLAQRPDGSCVFLTAEGLCRIHAEFGPEAKPLACQMFPLQLVPRAKGAVLTLRRACPTAAADEGPALQTYQSLARELAKAGKLLETTVSAPAIVKRHHLSWDDLLLVAKRLEHLLTDQRFPLVRRLVHGLQFCSLLERCKLKGFTGTKLTELCDLLVEEAMEAHELFAERTAPSAAVATLFRQAAAEYVRLHPTFVAGRSWLERWRMTRTAISFARGNASASWFAGDDLRRPRTPARTSRRSSSATICAILRDACCIVAVCVGKSDELDAGRKFSRLGFFLSDRFVVVKTVLYRPTANAS